MKFLRRSWDRYSKLGRKRKKKQKWRRPTGRDNKIRERRRGYPARVSIGYSGEKKKSGLVQGKVPIKVSNINDLKKVGRNNIIIISSVGKKKREMILESAKKKKFHVYNKYPLRRKEKNESK